MNPKLRNAYNSVLSQETGYVRKDPGGRVRIALAYPNSYYVGMSNLGFHTMYQLFNNMPDTLCERVFLPSGELEYLYSNLSIPLLSLESQTPVREFDILAFSCSFENDYINCLKILDLAGIPPYSADRDEDSPLVLMGGACTFFNVEPLSAFMDCFICGEAESIAGEFLHIFKAWLESNATRSDLLSHILGLDGVYVPRFYKYVYDSHGRICDPEPLYTTR